MSYTAIKYGHIADPAVQTTFHRADRYISDAYSMFFLPLKGWRKGGNCDFAIVLTLLCAVDGIAKYAYPAKAGVRQRFMKLLGERLFWPPSSRRWVEKGAAVKLLYLAFRNPLVHQLGEDDPHLALEEEPIVGKWGKVPPNLRNIDRIDRLASWNIAWPTMYERRENGKKKIKLSAAALYWTVKDMVGNLAAERR